MLRDVQRAMAELLMAGGTPDEKKAGDLIAAENFLPRAAWKSIGTMCFQIYVAR